MASPIVSYGNGFINLPYGTPNPDLAGEDFDAKVEATIPERYSGFGTDNCFSIVRQGDGHSMIRGGNNSVFIDCDDPMIDPDNYWDQYPNSDDPNTYSSED